MKDQLILGIVFVSMIAVLFIFPKSISRLLTGLYAAVLPRPITIRPLSMILAGAMMTFIGVCWIAYTTAR